MSNVPVVSVILVNYQGAEDTIACLQALEQLDWPQESLELIVVDNSPGGADVERLRGASPSADVLDAQGNQGFAGGCNLGASRATGDYIAFINNDARPHPLWVRAAVDVLATDQTIAAVASKVLDWDGERIDYVDGSLTWFGMGYKREVEQLDTGEWDRPRDVLFGTGAAMFVRRDVFDEVGGFDERFFMFYEDVDLGWRLNLLGWRVRFVPESLAYHRHHVSMKKFGPFRETFLLERNALFCMIKNYGDEALARTLAPALLLSVTRSVERGGIDSGALDLVRSPGGDGVGDMEVPKLTMAGVLAIADASKNVDQLWEERARLQAARKRTDRDLAPLFRQAIEPAYPLPHYLDAHQHLVKYFGIDALFSTRRRIVIITGDPIAIKMAGPAIRAWNIAEQLAEEHDVRLISTTGATVTHPRVDISAVRSPEGLRSHEQWADIIIFQGFAMASAPWLAESEKVIVCDIYDPMHLEQLEQTRGQDGMQRIRDVANTTTVLNDQLSRGDFFLCASEKQRHFWLGQLAGVGRLNPATYDADSSLNSLLSVVPFGLSSTPPVRTRPAIKGVVPGISDEDKVIIWAGGVYNWFDPLTLVRAVDQLARTRSSVRLFFLGMRNPNPLVPEMSVAADTRQLSDELGLTGTHVFFHSDWVDMADRHNFLLDADAGVSTHFEHVETTFAFRTRMLDYLWADLPIVATEGDTFGDLIDGEKLGISVSERDVGTLADALERVLFDQDFARECRANVSRVKQQYIWETALQPLIEFCRAPRRAPDLVSPEPWRDGSTSVVKGRLLDTGYRPSIRGDLKLVREYLSTGGARELGGRVVGRLRKNARTLVRGREAN